MKTLDWQLKTKHIGRQVLHFNQVDSTNNFAASLAEDPANDGVVVLADEQTAGRGQPGRSWFCPSGEGVLMSVLIFPPPAFRRASVLTAWAVVSTCEAINEITGLSAQIKWPNDVLIDGRKVCGILIEQKQGHAIVGIGLNVNQSADSFRAAELPSAGSLAMLLGKSLDRWEVARCLIHRLDVLFGRLDYLEERWKSLFGLLKKTVVVECTDGSTSGVLDDVMFDGVTVGCADGTTIRIRPETIRHLREVC